MSDASKVAVDTAAQLCLDAEMIDASGNSSVAGRMYEAADALARQAAEIVRLEKLVGGHKSIWKAVTSDRREWRKRANTAEAAKPFVAHYEPWMDGNHHPDSASMSCFARVTFGQFRTLRAALAHPGAASAPAAAADGAVRVAERAIVDAVVACYDGAPDEQHPLPRHVEVLIAALFAAEQATIAAQPEAAHDR